jgi:hypothetical protein
MNTTQIIREELIKVLNESTSLGGGIKKILKTTAAYQILDNSLVGPSTWTQGGCAVLADALKTLFKFPIYVVIDKNKNDSVQHFGVKTNQNTIIDADGEHKGIDEWLIFFKKNEYSSDGLYVEKLDRQKHNTSGIVFDLKASQQLVDLIKKHLK